MTERHDTSKVGGGLSEAERKTILRAHLPARLFATVERILADRLAAVEAERERWQKMHRVAFNAGVFQQTRAESAEAERDRLEDESAQRFASANMLHAKWQDAEAERHAVHVTAEPVAEDVVWCDGCEEWVATGAPERREHSPGETWQRAESAEAERNTARREKAEVEALLRAVEAVLTESCHHCGRLPDGDGDHTCPCPLSNSECLAHTAEPVVALASIRAALAIPTAGGER